MNAITISTPSTSTAKLAVVTSLVSPTAAANGNASRDSSLAEHRDVVARLYQDSYASLLRAALRLVDDRDEAADVVHEAFAELLASPRRKPTRAGAWCVVRGLARERRAARSLRETYEDDDADVLGEAAAAWLERALGG